MIDIDGSDKEVHGELERNLKLGLRMWNANLLRFVLFACVPFWTK